MRWGFKGGNEPTTQRGRQGDNQKRLAGKSTAMAIRRTDPRFPSSNRKNLATQKRTITPARREIGVTGLRRRKIPPIKPIAKIDGLIVYDESATVVETALITRNPNTRPKAFPIAASLAGDDHIIPNRNITALCAAAPPDPRSSLQRTPAASSGEAGTSRHQMAQDGRHSDQVGMLKRVPFFPPDTCR